MAFKIDQAKSLIQKQFKAQNITPKPRIPFKPSTPTDNSAVYVKRSENNTLATTVKQKIKLQFAQTNSTNVNQIAPTITPQEATDRADEIIKNNGGKNSLNTDNVGRDLAEIAKQNTADAWTVTQAMLGNQIDQDGKGKVKENDKDEIAQSFVESLSDGELSAIASDENGRKLLERMNTHLLSGSVHGDEIDTSERVHKALSEFVTFSNSSQGIHPHSDLAMSTPPGAALDTEATPEVAAAGLKTPFGMGGDDSAFQVQAFTDQLAAHKDDPQWIQQYYSALGSEKAAELISLTSSPGGYSNFYVGMGGSDQAAEVMLESTAIVRDSLETLRTSDKFNQSDMNSLVNALVKDGVNPNVAIEIFGKSTSPQLQEMFVRGAVANGNDAMDTSAAHVLSGMSESNQARILRSFSADDKLNGFIQGAMAGQQEALDLENYLRTGTGHSTITFGGVEKLLANATKQENIPYAPYSYEPYTPQLQRDIFNAVSIGLTNSKAFDNFEKNTEFKDNLSTLFIKHRDKLLFDAQVNPQGENSGTLFAHPEFQKGLEKFFQLTLLSSPPGEKYEETAVSVFKLINDGVTALDNPALANRDQAAFDDFVKNHGGIEPNQYAQMLGEVLGSVLDATGYAQESINKDEAARQKTIDLYLGLATSMIPGVGSKIASGITNEIFKQFVSKTGDFLTSQAKKSLETAITDVINGNYTNNDQIRRTELTDLINQMFYQGLSNLPNGASINGDSARSQFDFQGDILDGFLLATQFSRVDN